MQTVGLDKVTKLFGSTRALADVSLEVKQGEVIALMGPNGSGKSTMLSILSLVMRPSKGRVLVNGQQAEMTDPDLRGSIGLLSHHPLVYPDLTGRENLEIFARLHGLDDPAASVSTVEQYLGIDELIAQRPSRVLSRGQLQRLALARAVIASPRLLLLDEPATGLDSAALGLIDRTLADLADRGGMALVATHDPHVAARLATRLIVLRKGRIAIDAACPGSVDAVSDAYEEAVKGVAV